MTDFPRKSSHEKSSVFSLEKERTVALCELPDNHRVVCAALVHNINTRFRPHQCKIRIARYKRGHAFVASPAGHNFKINALLRKITAADRCRPSASAAAVRLFQMGLRYGCDLVQRDMPQFARTAACRRNRNKQQKNKKKSKKFLHFNTSKEKPCSIDMPQTGMRCLSAIIFPFCFL